jgi:cytochrome c6
METVRSENPALAFFVRAILALMLFGLVADVLSASDAAATYKAKCTMCHAANGAGDTAMGKKLAVRDLRSPEVQKQTDAQLAAVIADGKGKMPKYGDKMSAAEIGALVKHIRAMK